MLRYIFSVLLSFSLLAPAFAESISTRYGTLSTTQSENLTKISLENVSLTNLEAESASFFRVTPKGSEEHIIIQKWFPGLHCHHEFVLLTIYPNRNTQFSPAFGSCMELKAAKYLRNGAQITLVTPQIEGVKQSEMSFFWVNHKLTKGH